MRSPITAFPAFAFAALAAIVERARIAPAKTTAKTTTTAKPV